MATLELLNLGLRPYEEVWELQKKLHGERISGALDHDLVILCAHPPVITVGRGGSLQNILSSEEQLASESIQVHQIERGGDVTYHGPGQLIAYLIFDLNAHRRDVGWMMRTMEQTVIDTLEAFSIAASRIAGKTGVWIEKPDAASRKICSLGIRISRWCTLHGLALNILPDKKGFAHIHPCGLVGVDMTSIREELDNNTLSNQELIDATPQSLLKSLMSNFNFENICEGTRENPQNQGTIHDGTHPQDRVEASP